MRDEEERTLIGTLLEQRYRVDAPLARGGMSAVYRGVDTRLDRPVAIKVMDPRFAADPTFVERFEREARSAAKIHHPNVVAVHDQGLDGDNVYLVMELVDGATLRDLIAARGALPVPLALAILDPVLSALSAAHRAGLIHRDVKPENVLIGHAGGSGGTHPGGVVKVADFGLVRAISSAGSTKSNIILGTVAYLSPEQVTTGSATARGDVYSAGIVLYEMLTGAPPYHGDNALSVAYRHVNDDVPAPSSVVPGLPPLVDELVLRATRRDPAARPVDGAAFLAELRQVRQALMLPPTQVPVPVAASADETIPVSDSMRAVPEPPTEIAPVEPVDPEATVKVVAAVLPPAPRPVHEPTVVRKSGFSAVGPQGTRAMLRSDLEKVIESADRSVAYPPAAPTYTAPPTPPPGAPAPTGGFTGPPSGQVPQPGQGFGGPPSGHVPAQPSGGPRRPRKPLVLIIVGVLVLALAGTATWWFTSGRYTTVPQVPGTRAAAAEQAIRDAGLTPVSTSVRHNEVPAGVVVSSQPAGGAEALRGDQVTIVVSSGKPVVPDVPAGSTVDQAQQAITSADLQPQLDDGKNVFDDKVAKGKVVRLDPVSGTQLDVGQRVVVVVSKGAAPKPVPDVRGKTRDEAFQALRDAGFEPYDGQGEFAEDVEGGRVVRTTPGAGTKVNADGDRRVAVVVSTAVTVPDLKGKTADQARVDLAKVGLELDIQPFSNPQARIFVQSPEAGSRVAKGGRVSVFMI